MKRSLACLAALTLGVAVPAAHAEQPSADIIGGIIAQAGTLSAPAGLEEPAEPALPAPQQQSTADPVPAADIPEGAPGWTVKATLYHSGKGGVGTRDSLGCAVVPMRTVATDRNLIPRRSILFIKETVGVELADGTVHDGYWYASDIGGAVRGNVIDLYTGHGAGSMRPAQRFNQKRLSVTRVGEFSGCPRAGARVAMR